MYTCICIYQVKYWCIQVHKTDTARHKGMDKSRCIVGDFNIPLPSIVWSSGQKKINKETSEWNWAIDEMDLADIYRIFHAIAIEYTFSEQPMEISPRETIY
jgi:hypothetical protein